MQEPITLTVAISGPNHEVLDSKKLELYDQAFIFSPSLIIMRVNMNSNFRKRKSITTFPLSKLILDCSHELLNSQALGSGFCIFRPKQLQPKQLHNVKNPLAFITNQIKPNRFFPHIDCGSNILTTHSL